MLDEGRVSISAAAEQLGISSATLRRWEELFGLSVNRFGPSQSRMYSETEIEFLRKIKEFKEAEGCTLELMAKFLKKFDAIPDFVAVEEEVAAALAVPQQAFPGIFHLSDEDQHALKMQLGMMVKEATNGLQDYVDEKLGAVNSRLEETLETAVTRIDRLSENRSQELSDMLRELAERKRNKSIFSKIFGG